MRPDLVEIAIGKRYPVPLEENLVLNMHDDGGRLAVCLQLAISDPSVREHIALFAGPLTLGVLASPPLAWVVLTGHGLSFDAPYDLALESTRDGQTVLEHLRAFTGPGHPNRHLVYLDCVEARTGLVIALRHFTVSGEWMAALAGSVLASVGPGPRLTFDAAVERDHRRWPNVKAMIRDASAVEVCGKV